MRIQQGMTDAEVVENLSPKQRRVLDQMTRAQAVKRDKEAEYSQRALTRINDAITAGIPVRVIASTLRLSQARIYQIRDEARAAQAPATEPETAVAEPTKVSA